MAHYHPLCPCPARRWPARSPRVMCRWRRTVRALFLGCCVDRPRGSIRPVHPSIHPQPPWSSIHRHLPRSRTTTHTGFSSTHLFKVHMKLSLLHTTVPSTCYCFRIRNLTTARPSIPFVPVKHACVHGPYAVW